MADLSKMLGDVYGEPTPAPTAPDAPEWADEERLDEAFEGWTPGPSSDASAAERRFFGSRSDEDHRPLADDLASALSQAVLADTDATGATDEAVEAEPAVELSHAEPEVAEVEDEHVVDEAPAPYRPRRNAFDFGALDNDDDIYKAMAVLRNDPGVERGVVEDTPPPAPEPALAPVPVPVIEPEFTAPVVSAGPWQRDDDDILPRRARSRGVQLSFRRR